MITFSNNIKIVEKNLLDSDAQVWIQCCNCYRVQGSGVALAIKQKYPEVARVDSMTKYADVDKLGTISVAKVRNDNGKPLYILCNYGQFGFGREQRQVNYEAVYKAMEASKEYMTKNNLTSLALPFKYASDRAGGSWLIVSAMIEELFGNSKINVEICKLPE